MGGLAVFSMNGVLSVRIKGEPPPFRSHIKRDSSHPLSLEQVLKFASLLLAILP